MMPGSWNISTLRRPQATLNKKYGGLEQLFPQLGGTPNWAEEMENAFNRGDPGYKGLNFATSQASPNEYNVTFGGTSIGSAPNTAFSDFQDVTPPPPPAAPPAATGIPKVVTSLTGGEVPQINVPGPGTGSGLPPTSQIVPLTGNNFSIDPSTWSTILGKLGSVTVPGEQFDPASGTIPSLLKELGPVEVPQTQFTIPNIGGVRSNLLEQVGSFGGSDITDLFNMTGIPADLLRKLGPIQLGAEQFPLGPNIGRDILAGLRGSGQLPTAGELLPGQEDMVSQLQRIRPGPMSAESLLPTAGALATVLGYRRPGAFGAETFLPGEEALSQELGLRRPMPFSVGQFLPGREELTQGLMQRRPGAFGIEQFLPGAEELRTGLLGRRPLPFAAGQFLPGAEDLSKTLGQRIPGAFGPETFLPGQEDLTRELLSRRPLPFAPGQFLPGQEEMAQTLMQRLPSAFGAEQFLPGKEDMVTALQQIRPGAFGAKQLMPDVIDMQARLGDLFPGAFRPEDLLPGREEMGTALQGLLPEFGLRDIFPGAEGIGSELSGLMPKFGLRDIFPGAEDLGDQIRGFIPRFGTEDVFPGLEDIGTDITSKLPRFALPDIFPGIGSLREDILGAGGFPLKPADMFGDWENQLRQIREGATNIPVTWKVPPLPSGDVTTGTGGTGGVGAIDNDFIKKMQEAILGATTAPQTAADLERDPLTASLLADLERKQQLEDQELTNRLNQYGVLGSGDTARLLPELQSTQRRERLGVLGDTAERMRAEREGARGQGVSLASPLLSYDTANKDRTMDLLGAAIAALDPNIKFGEAGGFNTQLAQAILSMGNLSPEMMAIFRNLFQGIALPGNNPPGA